MTPLLDLYLGWAGSLRPAKPRRFRQILRTGLLVLLSTAAIPGHSTPSQDQAAQLTQALIAQQKIFEQAQGVEKARQLDRLVELAEQRYALLSELMESDPEQLFRVVIPEDRRKGMPDAVQDMLMKEIELGGKLESLYEDYEDGSHQLHHFLKTDLGERLELHMSNGSSSTSETGKRVVVKGLLLGSSGGEKEGLAASVVTAECCTGAETTQAPPAGAYTFGEQKTLVMLVNFQDKMEQPFSIQEVESTVFGSTNDFYLENSQGQTWLSGAVVGWYTLAISSTNCDYWAIANEANSAATASGLVLENYDRLVYAFPKNSCGWAGLGTVGGMKSWAWLNGAVTTYVSGHELGHNLGLGHSMGLECGEDIIEGSGCYNVGYANRIDIMGSPNPGHFNAFQKDRLGWLGQEVQTITQSGNYSVIPYASSASGVRALRIWQGQDASTGEDQWYYIEFRQNVGLDSFISNANYVDSDNVLNGVIVNRGILSKWDSNTLLDMTPGSYPDIFYDFDDPALGAGQQFIDATAGVSISTASVSSNQATVSITLGAESCSPSIPAVELSPGESPWVEAGTSVTYFVTVTNMDGSSCGDSSFNLSVIKPTGWSTSFAENSITLAPGASRTTELTVSSAATATDGFYDLFVTSENGVGSATGSVTYVVANSVANTDPVAVDDTSSTEENTPVTINVLGNDYDPDGDGLLVTTLSGINGSGVINNDNTVTFTPVAGFTGVESFTYTTSDGNGGSGSAQVFVTVNAVETTNNPPIAVDDTAEIIKGSSVNISVLSNDSDPDGDVITITATTSAAKGSVQVNGDGTLTYTPAKNFKSTDAFAYTISDGSLTATAWVSIIAASDTAGGGSSTGGKGGGKGPNK